MAQNIGKRFEADIKVSIPDYVMVIRLPDPPQAFTQRTDTRFSLKNPCDYICYDTQTRTLYCFELKTTSGKSIGFEDIDSEEKQNKMIHRHQILGLQKFSAYKNVVPGFLLNFRDEKNDMERTYFQSIENFLSMTKQIGKSSCNEMDILLHGAVKIPGDKKRTHYAWDMDSFFKSCVV